VPDKPRLLGETLALTGGPGGGDWKWAATSLQLGATVGKHNTATAPASLVAIALAGAGPPRQHDFAMIFRLLSVLIFVLAAEFSTWAAQVTVFAAASLTDSFKQISADYERISGDKIVFSFAASGTLARQIEAGAPADIFFSADEAKADALEKKGLLVSETRKSLLGNSLVIVTTSDAAAIHSSADLTNAAIQHLALGDVKSVPAGTYAKTYLEKIGVWPAVESKVVPCENVRAVLAAVESGNVDAGFVYKTDAAISKKVRVAFEVPAADAPKISYPLALLKDSPQPEAAKKFIAYLDSKAAAAVFKKFGFIVLSSPPAK
jgi:molybdate transport system substrate-binding protein